MRESSDASDADNSPARPRLSTSDAENAGRLVALFGDTMRYCHPWKCWLVWDGKRWAEDQAGAAMRLAKRAAQAIINDACVASMKPGEIAFVGVGGGKLREPSEWTTSRRTKSGSTPGTRADEQLRSRVSGDVANHHRLKNMLMLAAPELPILPAELDRDPWLLNCDNGTLDLRTGELRQHQRADFITRLCPTPYLPAEPHDEWDRFTASVFESPSLVDFLKRFLGYCLTGDVREQFLPIFFGEGANGKSTLLETFAHALGPDYAMKSSTDLLIVRKNEAHPTERADLFGKRFVACVESGLESRLNETLVKELTGGDSIRARRMYENHWQFLPTHKAVLCTNHVPEVRGIGHAIWRRLALVPFRVTFWDADKGETGPAERAQDKSLPERLRREAAGILAWCVEGCYQWQRERLKLPPEVVAATGQYRSEQDAVAEFIDDACVINDAGRVRAGDLNTAYMFWCAEQGRADIGHRLFGMAVGQRFEKIISNGVWYKGLELAEKGKTQDWT